MIGWRPYLLTVLAVLLLLLVVLDVSAATQQSNLCASADALNRAHQTADARRQYEAVLTTHPEAVCAQNALLHMSGDR